MFILSSYKRDTCFNLIWWVLKTFLSISDNVTWGIVRLTYINLKKIINWTKMLKLIVRVRIYTYLKKKNRKYLHIILLSLALYSSQENSFCQLSCNFLLVSKCFCLNFSTKVINQMTFLQWKCWTYRYYVYFEFLSHSGNPFTNIVF
jgi:hypothetical protein